MLVSIRRLAGENSRLRTALECAPPPLVPRENHCAQWRSRYDLWFHTARREALHA